MMQQPVFPHEHAGNSGQQQQMLLCPVRLVYETQILVQPGDKIQPNQTILINPPTHHQPPWAQNRLQNQVIYVQNVPNNFLPSVQQHMDQNSMFLPQNYGFPQVIQRPMIAAPNQEPIQTATLQVGNVSANIQSQIQANIAQFMPNERIQVTNNYNHQSVGNSIVQLNQTNNTPTGVQNQIANVPINNNNRQIQQSVPKPVTEIQNTPPQTQEITAQNYRQLVNQHITHQMNLARVPMQQAITMLPMSSMVQKPPTSDNSTPQITPVQQQTIATPNQNAIQPTFATTSTSMQIDPRKNMQIVHKAPTHSIATTPIQHQPKNPTFSYRPIQPRPQQYRANVTTPAMTVQPNLNIQVQQNANQNQSQTTSQVQNPNIIDINRIVGPNIINTTTQVTNFQKNDNNNAQFNRKRKSESPDEVHRKLTIVPATQTITSNNSITVKRIENLTPLVTPSQPVSVTKVNTNEIGVNTNPPIKMNPKVAPNRNMLQINPILEQNTKLREELAKPITTAQQIKPPVTMTVTNVTSNTVLPTTNVPVQVEKEKLVRNTVFPQARFGRLLTDKEDTPVNVNPVIPVNVNPVAPVNVHAVVPREKAKVDTDKDKTLTPVKVKQDATHTEKATVSEVVEESSPPEACPKEKPLSNQERVEKEEKPPPVERNAEEKMLSDSMSRLKGTEANEIKLKSPRDYILTHVLDGFVIQESNVAFPIRLPLKEKTLAINAAKERILKEAAAEDRERKTDRVPDISHLNLTENERLRADGEESMEPEVTEGNPFVDVKHCAVKTWTVEQLASHLSKYDWAETIAVLREHEIDGESLFLVSKSQLVSIGVKETHADVICDFVKS